MPGNHSKHIVHGFAISSHKPASNRGNYLNGCHVTDRVMPIPDLPMTGFLKLSSSDLYTWPGDNGTSTSFNPDLFDFSAINFSNLPPSESGPHFRMDQYSFLLNMSNTPSLPAAYLALPTSPNQDMAALVDSMPVSNTPLLPAAYPALPTSPNQDMTAPVDSMPMSNTPLLPAAHPALPTLPNQNNTTSTLASNGDYSVLNNAINNKHIGRYICWDKK